MSKEHENIGSCSEKCGQCNICNLFVCKHCRLFEGCLTTHCPGEQPSIDKADKVYEGKLNYRGNLWLEGECSEHTPVFFHKHAKEYKEQHNVDIKP